MSESMSERCDGYYWVKRNGFWMVAEWENFTNLDSNWWLPGVEREYLDGDFEAIGRRIIEPAEQENA